MAAALSLALPGLCCRRPALAISCAISNGNPSAATASKLTLHVGETSITMPMAGERARALRTTMEELIQTFRAKQEDQGRPKRIKSVEFAYAEEEGVSFELFCNPNAYANTFQAKVLVTVSDGKMSVTAEADLSRVKADVDGFVESLGEV